MADGQGPLKAQHLSWVNIKIAKKIPYTLLFAELPFMSVNLARRARALQTLRLPDDIDIPDTSQRGSYRPPPADKYKDPPSKLSMRPKYDPSMQSKLFKKC